LPAAVLDTREEVMGERKDDTDGAVSRHQSVVGETVRECVVQARFDFVV
jgi:hypothetical protein